MGSLPAAIIMPHAARRPPESRRGVDDLHCGINVASDETVAGACDVLVERLVRVDFAPAQRGKKIALACAVYFSCRPLAVGRRPLEMLLAQAMAAEKGSFDTEGIRKLVEDRLSRAD